MPRRNFAQTILSGAVDDTVTTWPVVDATLLPAAPCYLGCDTEIVLCTVIVANDLTVTRHADGTTAAAHALGSTVANVLTAGEFSALESTSNKSTSVATDAASDTKYPSVKAIKDYADGLVTGLLDYRGAYDAHGNTYPTTGGSGTAGAVMKGDMWVISVAGVLGSVAVQIGDTIIANIDTPAQTAANWNTLNTNVSYVPEDQANKENTALDTSTTKYPSNAIVKAAVDAKAPAATAVVGP